MKKTIISTLAIGLLLFHPVSAGDADPASVGPTSAFTEFETTDPSIFPNDADQMTLQSNTVEASSIESNQCKYKGTFKGQYYGTAYGPWSFNISNTCQLRGTAINDEGSLLALNGSSSSDGSLTLVAGSTSSGATFSGHIKDNGSISGTWYQRADNGWFRGQYVSAPKIGSLSQKEGKPGDLISISGSNFWYVPNKVLFGKTKAEIVDWDSYGITVAVPNISVGPNGKSVALKIRSFNGKFSHPKKFLILPADATE